MNFHKTREVAEWKFRFGLSEGLRELHKFMFTILNFVTIGLSNCFLNFQFPGGKELCVYWACYTQ